MSFFTKLRDRLTRSSSKIGAGLDVQVCEEGAEPPGENGQRRQKRQKQTKTKKRAATS